MTKRIFGGTFAVSLIAIVSVLALVLTVMYSRTQKSYTEQIEEEAKLLFITMQYTDASTDIENLANLGGFSNRITYIAPDGTVLYDNKADPAQMENHSNREEIIAAKAVGNGTATRISSTMAEKTIYCARELADGCVVRVSATHETIFSTILSMWWEILLVLILSVMVSGGLATLISRAIVKPINNIDLKKPDIDESYGEIAPLLHKINEQNREIKEHIKELTQSKNEFSLITENMSEGFIITDRKTEVLSYNSAAVRILGAGEVEHNSSVLALNRSESFRRAVEKALAGERSEQLLTIASNVYQLISNPVYSSKTISGAVIIILDVTEKEQREKLRREFTSNVSHELKTPLTTIYGISDMLVGGIVKPEDVAGFAGNIRDESGRLITLIEDIIKLSQLDENNFSEHREDVDITELARTAADRLKMKAAEQHITLSVSGEPAEYCGIRSVLEEMIYNLLDNAVKYNKPGGRAEVSVTAEQEHVTIVVSDTGIGIPEDSITRVFERFYRADKSHSRKIGGTGLGLSIVKHGTMLHGGTVSISSTLEVGTSVTVTLPR